MHLNTDKHTDTNVWDYSHTYLEQKLAALEVLGQDVQHPDHLREDEDAVATLLQTHQQLVQQHQLPAAPNQVLGGGGIR